MLSRIQCASLAVVLALTFAMAAGPAGAAGLPAGTLEISPSAVFSHSSLSLNGEKLGSLTVLAMSGNVGYCVTNHVEGEGGFLLSHVSISAEDNSGDGSASATGVGLNGGLRFNLSGSGDVIPFAYAGAGFVSYSGDEAPDTKVEVDAPILQAGVRLLVGPTGSMNFFVQYSHRTNADGAEDVSDNQFALGVGLSLFPGRK
jgi:hypothetical protein